MKMYIKILKPTYEYNFPELISDILAGGNKMPVYVGEKECGEYDPICIAGYVNYDVDNLTFKFTKADTEMAKTIDIVFDEKITPRILRLFPVINEVDGCNKCELFVLEDIHNTRPCTIE